VEVKVKLGEEKLSIEELSQKIDELLSVLNVISGDLAEVSKSLKVVSKSAAVPAVSTVSTANKRDINEIKQAFSPQLEGMLIFEEGKNVIIVRPRRFLGSDNFAKIASVIRELGGEYISAGKNSHFKVPRS
jgi:hypothetical protein